MTLTVLKPFNSTRRRFVEGDTLDEDADVTPHTLGDLKMRHFLGDAKRQEKPAKGD